MVDRSGRADRLHLLRIRLGVPELAVLFISLRRYSVLYRGVRFAARIIEQMWYKVRTFATSIGSGRTDAEQAKDLCIPAG